MDTVQQLLDMTSTEVVSLGRLFGLLSDPTRVRIILLLCKGELNVSRLCTALALPQPTVSHHLGLLRRGGLLATRRDGKAIYYSLDNKLNYSSECELHIRGMAGVKVKIVR